MWRFDFDCFVSVFWVSMEIDIEIKKHSRVVVQKQFEIGTSVGGCAQGDPCVSLCQLCLNSVS